MQAELQTRRRVLSVTYQRYLDADRRWQAALGETRRWFPLADRPQGAMIGDPGSRMRRAYEGRARALAQFEVARAKFETARRRLAERSVRRAPRVLMLTRIEIV